MQISNLHFAFCNLQFSLQNDMEGRSMNSSWQHGLRKLVAGACVALLVAAGTSRAGDADLELRALIEQQNKQIQEQNRQIDELKKRLDATEATKAPAAG